jgi:hypothetical protein
MKFCKSFRQGKRNLLQNGRKYLNLLRIWKIWESVRKTYNFTEFYNNAEKNDLGLFGEGDMKEIIFLKGKPQKFPGPFEIFKLNISCQSPHFGKIPQMKSISKLRLAIQICTF